MERKEPTWINFRVVPDNPYVLEAIRQGLHRTRGSLYSHIELISENNAGSQNQSLSIWGDSIRECRIILEQIEEIEKAIRKISASLDACLGEV